jgi:hypothetical protein
MSEVPLYDLEGLSTIQMDVASDAQKLLHEAKGCTHMQGSQVMVPCVLFDWLKHTIPIFVLVLSYFPISAGSQPPKFHHVPLNSTKFSTQIPPNFHPTSTQRLCKIYPTSTKHPPNIYQVPPNIHQTSTKHPPNIHQTSIKFHPTSTQHSFLSKENGSTFHLNADEG